MPRQLTVRRWCLAAFATLAPAGLSAQQPERPASVRDRLAARLDGPAAALVAGIVDSAGREGVPAEPLVVKALEGGTKHAPGDQIAAAVRLLARDLGRARSALGPARSEQELAAGAAALRAGAPHETLAALALRREPASLVVPLGVLAELLTRGVAPDRAAEVVLALAERGASDAEYITVAQGLATGRAAEQGARPPTAAAPDRRGDARAPAAGGSARGAPPAEPPIVSPPPARPSSPRPNDRP